MSGTKVSTTVPGPQLSPTSTGKHDVLTTTRLRTSSVGISFHIVCTFVTDGGAYALYSYGDDQDTANITISVSDVRFVNNSAWGSGL